MKLWHRAAPRIVSGAVLAGLVGTLLGAAVVFSMSVVGVGFNLRGLILEGVSADELARCEASPESWSLRVPPAATVHAYDLESGRSRNASAPALPPSVSESLRRGDLSAASVEWLQKRGVSIYVDTGRAGACRVLSVSWPQSRSRRVAVALRLLLLVLIPVGIAATLGSISALRPVLERIDRLRRTAARVGAEEGYVPRQVAEQDELGELALALDRAHARIREDAGRIAARQLALERHLADIAHDLRTPLSALQLRLERAGRATQPSEWADAVTRCLEDTVYLCDLSENLWAACQLGEDFDTCSTREPCDLSTIVDIVAARFTPLARRRGIRLEVFVPDECVEVNCRAAMAQRALGNLVNNAVLYGRHGGHVAIVLALEADSHFVLSVVDDGPGVPEAELPKLGLRSFRGESAKSRRPEGGGLGLAITHAVADQCGWTVRFELEKPHGLRVTLEGQASPNTGRLAAK